MKKILTIAIALAAGFSIAQADDEKKPKGDKGGKGKGDMLAKLDTDKNGSISQAEFEAGPIAKKMKESGKGDPAKIFAKIDADSSGEITGEEFKKHMEARKGGGKGKKGGEKGKGKGEKKPKSE